MPYGYDQGTWNGMTQKQRNMIKAAQGALPADGGNLLAPGLPGQIDFAPLQQEPAPYVAPAPVDYGPAPDYGSSDTTPSDSPTDLPVEYPAFVEPVRKNLATSPEWLAYLNALGLESSTFAADITRQRGLFQSDANRQIADLGPQYGLQRRGITGSAESRGVLRSGEFQTRLANSRAAQGAQTGAIQGGLTGQLSNLESQLAQKQIDIAARRASQQLSLLGTGQYV